MKKSFFSGLVILLPIALTIVVIVWLIDLVTTPFVGIFEYCFKLGLTRVIDIYKYRTLILVFSRISAIIALVLFTFFLGLFARWFFSGYLIKKMQALLLKIPYVKSIYQIAQEVTRSFIAPENKKVFKGSVLIPFPHFQANALGLVSGDAPEEVTKILQHEAKTVFVPTAPHPISGFLLMVSKDHLKPLDLDTEDVFKYLISCGIYEPHPNKK